MLYLQPAYGPDRAAAAVADRLSADFFPPAVLYLGKSLYLRAYYRNHVKGPEWYAKDTLCYLDTSPSNATTESYWQGMCI